jgi:hypothetical protein
VVLLPPETVLLPPAELNSFIRYVFDLISGTVKKTDPYDLLLTDVRSAAWERITALDL